MQLYLRLAWRNVWRHRRRTVIIVAAMALSLGMMIMYDGLIDGFNNAIYGNAIRVLGGNIQIHAQGYGDKVDSNPLLPIPEAESVVASVGAHPEVISAARRIQTGGLASSNEGAFPVSIIGIQPEVEAPVSLIAENTRDGRFLEPQDGDSVVIGAALADAMGAAVGDRITLVGSDAHKQNRQRTVTVVGIYDIGMASIEKKSVYMTLGEAQALYRLPGQTTEIVVNLKKLGTENAVVAALSAALPGYEVASWSQNYPELGAAITNKNAVMNIFGVVIIMIAGVGILNLLLMAIYERTREIGLLGAMGLKPAQIAGLFVLEGGLIGLVGALVGAAVGLALNGLLGQVGLDYSGFSDTTEYMALISGRVYPSLGLNGLAPRAVTVIVISLLAAAIPAIEASRREPAQALHHV